MACGCKQKKQVPQPTQTPQTINVSLAEQTSTTLSTSQEKLVNEIVDKLKNVGDTSQ